MGYLTRWWTTVLPEKIGPYIITREMETLTAANIDDQGVVLPIQQFVVFATL